jgi:hypothetical protein
MLKVLYYPCIANLFSLTSAEHERMVEAYALMDHKLQQALLEHDNFENTIRNLKVCTHYSLLSFLQ